MDDAGEETSCGLLSLGRGTWYVGERNVARMYAHGISFTCNSLRYILHFAQTRIFSFFLEICITSHGNGIHPSKSGDWKSETKKPGRHRDTVWGRRGTTRDGRRAAAVYMHMCNCEEEEEEGVSKELQDQTRGAYTA